MRARIGAWLVGVAVVAGAVFAPGPAARVARATSGQVACPSDPDAPQAMDGVVMLTPEGGPATCYLDTDSSPDSTAIQLALGAFSSSGATSATIVVGPGDYAGFAVSDPGLTILPKTGAEDTTIHGTVYIFAGDTTFGRDADGGGFTVLAEREAGIYVHVAADKAGPVHVAGNVVLGQDSGYGIFFTPDGAPDSVDVVHNAVDLVTSADFHTVWGSADLIGIGAGAAEAVPVTVSDNTVSLAVYDTAFSGYMAGVSAFGAPLTLARNKVHGWLTPDNTLGVSIVGVDAFAGGGQATVEDSAVDGTGVWPAISVDASATPDSTGTIARNTVAQGGSVTGPLHQAIVLYGSGQVVGNTIDSSSLEVGIEADANTEEDGIVVEDNSVSGVARAGGQGAEAVSATGDDVTVSGNRLQVDGLQAGIHVRPYTPSGGVAVIEGNDVQGEASLGGPRVPVGVFAEGVGDTTVRGNEIAVEDVDTGLWVQADPALGRTQIVGNRVHAGSNAGIQVESEASVTLEDNQVGFPGESSPADCGWGLRVSAAVEARLVGNRVVACRSGAYLGDSGAAWTVRNNAFVGAGPASSDLGLWRDGPASDFQATGNVVRGFATAVSFTAADPSTDAFGFGAVEDYTSAWSVGSGAADLTYDWWGAPSGPPAPAPPDAVFSPWAVGTEAGVDPADEARVWPGGAEAVLHLSPALLLAETADGTVTGAVYLSGLPEGIELGYRLEGETAWQLATDLQPGAGDEASIAIPSPGPGTATVEIAFLAGAPGDAAFGVDPYLEPIGAVDTVQVTWAAPPAPPGAPAAGEGGAVRNVIGSQGGRVSSVDGGLTVSFPAGSVGPGTTVTIVSQPAGSAPAPGPGMLLLGDRVYAVTVTGADGRPVTSFEPPLELAFALDAGFPPPGAGPPDVGVVYYDPSLGVWVPVPASFDAESGTLTAEVDHLTTFALASGAPPVPPDLAGHWSEDDVLRLLALGAVSGYEDGSFRPEGEVTRAEFVKMLVAATPALGGQLPGPGEAAEELAARLRDAAEVPGWAAPYVAAALSAGLVTGYEDGTFRAGAYLTRAEVAELLARAWAKA
ncbi:MAG: S-layer homology domain-containing protein, partial [Clostridia bacterium]|nr:S-layer homology domain-containing protein [Clostridia bacterium]